MYYSDTNCRNKIKIYSEEKKKSARTTLLGNSRAQTSNESVRFLFFNVYLLYIIFITWNVIIYFIINSSSLYFIILNIPVKLLNISSIMKWLFFLCDKNHIYLIRYYILPICPFDIKWKIVLHKTVLVLFYVTGNLNMPMFVRVP